MKFLIPTVLFFSLLGISAVNKDVVDKEKVWLEESVSREKKLSFSVPPKKQEQESPGFIGERVSPLSQEEKPKSVEEVRGKERSKFFDSKEKGWRIRKRYEKSDEKIAEEVVVEKISEEKGLSVGSQIVKEPSPQRIDEFINVGYIGNQVHISGDQAVTIASGIDYKGLRKSASVSLVDLDTFRVRSQSRFPLGWNLYRGAVEAGKVWVSERKESHLYRLNMLELEKESLLPSPLFKTVSGAQGMETVLRIKGKTWVTYSNISKESMTPSSGEIVILGEDLSVEQILITETPNPKEMIFGGGRVFISVGSYDEKGQVFVVDPGKLPLDGQKIYLNRRGSPFHESYDLDGVSGAMFFDGDRSHLFVCDFTEQGGSFFRVDLASRRSHTFRGGFNSCGSILVNGEFIYVLNFNGGSEGAEEEHLYVFERNSGRQICAKTIYPGKIQSAAPLFPNQVKLYKKRGRKFLVIMLSGSFQGEEVFPAYLGKLPLDDRGLPSDCQ